MRLELGMRCILFPFPDNEERFWLGGAAHERIGGRWVVETAPVSQKRVGPNRHPEAAMGIVLGGRWSGGHAAARIGKLVLAL
jgi:hypothetical protein